MIKREEVLDQMSEFCKIQTKYFERRTSYQGGWPTYSYWINNMSYQLSMLANEGRFTQPERHGTIHTLTLVYDNVGRKTAYVSFDFNRTSFGKGEVTGYYEAHTRGVSGLESFDKKRFEVDEVIPALFKFMEPNLSDRMIRNYRLNGILS